MDTETSVIFSCAVEISNVRATHCTQCTLPPWLAQELFWFQFITSNFFLAFIACLWAFPIGTNKVPVCFPTCLSACPSVCRIGVHIYSFNVKVFTCAVLFLRDQTWSTSFAVDYYLKSGTHQVLVSVLCQVFTAAVFRSRWYFGRFGFSMWNTWWLDLSRLTKVAIAEDFTPAPWKSLGLL